MDTTIKDKICSFDNLYKAMMVCKRSVGWKESVMKWTLNGAYNCTKLRDSLYDGSYKISDYTKFTIYEPKKRDIVSTRFKDRVFQRSLCDNYLYDELTRHFIYDNGACQKGKGTLFSLNRLERHIHGFYNEYKSDGYVLKMDIKNYFGSTPHQVAKDAIAKRCRDEWARNIVFDIIDSFDGDVGLGLGSQVTQLIQLSVLDDIDHYIKEKLHVKHYIRYMDDMLVISNSKSQLYKIRNDIRQKLFKIGLILNKKKTQILKLSNGVSFLGFKFILLKTGRVLRLLLKSNLSRRKRKIMSMLKASTHTRITINDIDDSFRSWLSHLIYGDCHNIEMYMKKYYYRRRCSYL